MTDIPIMYTFRRCPYAMRARLAVWSSQMIYEHREIVLRDKPAHMLEISPKGTIPVLVLPDGTVIDESLDIMHFVLGQNNPEGWLNQDQQKTDALIAENDGSFKRALDRYKYPNRYPDEDTSDARDNARAFLEKLNALLQHHEFLVSDEISLADIAIFPFIRQCAHVDLQWFTSLGLKPLQKWLSYHKESKRFKNIMAKYEPWASDDKPLIMTFDTT